MTIPDDGHADENEENVKDNKGESPSGDSSSKDDTSRMQDLSERVNNSPVWQEKRKGG